MSEGRTLVEGRAWVFGDKIDTDLIAPGIYMKLPPEELAAHCLEAVNPRFAAEARPGDILIAGQAFGIGSSREHAASALKRLGLGAILACSFARIFWRNAINVGLPALTLEEKGVAADGDRLALDLEHGLLHNVTAGTEYRLEPLPPHLQPIIAAGGLLPFLKENRPWEA